MPHLIVDHYTLVIQFHLPSEGVNQLGWFWSVLLGGVEIYTSSGGGKTDESRAPLSFQQAQLLFNELDQNKDGVITREEFMRMQVRSGNERDGTHGFSIPTPNN